MSNNDIMDDIGLSIENSLSQGGLCYGKKIVQLVAKVIFSATFTNALVRDSLRVLSRDELKDIFSPRNMLKK